MASRSKHQPLPFICFEGIDGAGKTTQIGLLKTAFSNAGIAFHAAREPGSTKIGGYVRDFVAEDMPHNLTPGQQLILFAAAHIAYLHGVVLPSLTEDIFFLSDRYGPFNFTAYQGADGVRAPDIDTVNTLASNDFLPGLTFIFDLKAEVALERLRQNPAKASRFEAKGLAYLQDVQRRYKHMRSWPGVHMLDAEQSEETLHRHIISKVNAIFGLTLQTVTFLAAGAP